MKEKLWDVSEVAQILNLKISTIYALVHQQRIPHVKIGRCLRFRASDIESWVESQASHINSPDRR